MSASPRSDADRVNSLRLLGMGFFGAAAALLVVLIVLSGGWEPADDGLARTGTIVAGLVGVVGLGGAVWWRNHAVAAPMKPDRLLTSWILAVAIAEVGMILGFVFAFLSRSLTPFVVGAVVFAVSLLVLTAAISQVDLET